MTLLLIIFLPIIAAAAIGLGAPARLAALLASGANLFLGLVVALVVALKGDGEMHFESARQLLDSPELTLGFGVDGISATLVLLTVIVTFCAVLVSPARVAGRGEGLYYISSLLIAAGALGAFCATDLFFFYAFHELALIPTFLMIGLHGHGRDRVATAWKITIYLGAGSLVLLAGLIALYASLSPAGGATFDIAKLTELAAGGEVEPGVQAWIFLVLLIGFGTLVSLFPFHSWAAPAYAAAPTPVAMLHAGVLKKFGLYGMMRVAFPMLPEGFREPLWAGGWTPEDILLVLLLGNILYVGLVTISQRYLDRMLGASSVMHMGYAFLGIACLNAAGWGGAVFMMFAHGISIALLFALCGALRGRLDTLEMSRLGGLGARVPVTATLFAFAAFASLGLPGFANFASEITIFFAAFEGALGGDAAGLGGLQVATVLALWGVVISAVYMLRAYRNIFQGELGGDRRPDEVSPLERGVAVLMIAVLLLTGFFPNLILNLVGPALGLPH